jgi:hypothetical protein
MKETSEIRNDRNHSGTCWNCSHFSSQTLPSKRKYGEKAIENKQVKEIRESK